MSDTSPSAAKQTPSPKILRQLILTVGLVLLSCMTALAETPQVGARAPDFSLYTPLGQSVRLSSLTGKGSVVLVVLRGFPGYQCPYCVKQVHEFIEHAAAFAEKKSTVLFVYPGPPADLDVHAKEALARQADLPTNMKLVTDPDYTVTNLYGLRWDAPKETAYPSTFILNGNGMVVFEKISHAHGDRTSAEDILKQIPAK